MPIRVVALLARLVALQLLQRFRGSANEVACVSSCLGARNCDELAERTGAFCEDLMDYAVWEEHACDCQGCQCTKKETLFNVSVRACAEIAVSTGEELVAALEDNSSRSSTCISIAGEAETTKEITVADFARVEGGTVVARGQHRHYHVREKLELVSTVLLNGYDDFAGGCVFVESFAILYIANSRLVNCTTLRVGGGIAAWRASSVVLHNSAIVGAFAGLHGGAIFAINSYADVLDVAFERCGSASYGGAIYATESIISLRRAEISQAVAYLGGGIYAQDGHIEIENGTAVVSSSVSNAVPEFLETARTLRSA